MVTRGRNRDDVVYASELIHERMDVSSIRPKRREGSSREDRGQVAYHIHDLPIVLLARAD